MLEPITAPIELIIGYFQPNTKSVFLFLNYRFQVGIRNQFEFTPLTPLSLFTPILIHPNGALAHHQKKTT
jgi:hypothetical protein